MDKNGSACSNFYDYVCRNWPIQYPRPQSHSVWTEFNVAGQEALEQMRKLLESPHKSTSDSADAKTLFNSCMKLPFLQKSPSDVISRIMTIVGHWPIILPRNKKITVPWSVIDNEYIKRTAESAIFDFNLILGAFEEKRYIATKLKPLFSPYGSIVRFHGWGLLSGHKNHYKNFLYKIIEAVSPLNSTPSIRAINADLIDVINFREDLRQIIKKLTGESVEITIKELQDLFDKEMSKDDLSKINWLQKISAIYTNLADPRVYNVTDTTTVFVHKTYFSKLARLLKKTSKSVIANHIHLYFAERYLAFPPDVQQAVESSFTNDIYTKAYIREEPPRWQRCIEEHHMQIVLREMYIAGTFPPTHKAKIEGIFSETKKMVEQQIYASTWLDDDMKEKSLAKIHNMTGVIGYPEWMGLNTYELYDEDILDPLMPDIYYHGVENSMCVSAAGLKVPLFSPNVPYVIQYGATSAMFGHEVYHVFNRNALKYDCYGEKWWSSSMRKKFEDQVKCFEKQYREKRLQEARNHGINMWGTLPDTSSEDISDVMGIKSAYRGYKQRVVKSNGNCPILPGFENTSCDQLFFIAFAHSLCADFSDVGKTRLLLTDIHSFPRVRVNGAALNMKEFGTAFGCKPTDPMMWAQRCDIWKD